MTGPRTALVLAGGGARGAYEVGALDILLPALRARGCEPTLLVGTSVGAMNATWLAANGVGEASMRGLLSRWRQLNERQVLRGFTPGRGMSQLLRYVGDALELRDIHMAGLLEPEPLRENLASWVDWPALHRRLAADGRALALTATDLYAGCSVVFLEGAEAPRDQDDLEWVTGEIGPDHALASAAIPIVFPPVKLSANGRERWFIDGGTRLNAPIRPALELGADRLIVIGMQPAVRPEVAADQPRSPRLADGAVQILHALLTDPIAEDIRRLRSVNALVGDQDRAEAAGAFRRSQGKRPYRRIPYAYVAPRDGWAISAIAERVWKRSFTGAAALRRPETALLGRLLGGGSDSRAELLSYLLFDAEFAVELIELGRADAQRWLSEVPEVFTAQTDAAAAAPAPDGSRVSAPASASA